MIRCVLICPGRGSYGPKELGSLPPASPMVEELDRYRRAFGRPTLSELDRAKAFSPRLHLAGEHASLLTFACTAVDAMAIDPRKAQVVAVSGNSMGWYTALHLAGALDLAGAARLVETLGHYQEGNVVGGQAVYPLVDDEWREEPRLDQEAEAALRLDGVFLSIRLGGMVVFGASEAGLASLRRVLPKVRRGEVEYPLVLAMHSAFHTPLMEETRQRAGSELADLAFSSPTVSLVSGAGRVFRPWAAPAELFAYTLGEQLVAPFDFSLAVATLAGEFAPDSFIVAGPGDRLGAPVAQALIHSRFRGLRDKKDFLEAQGGRVPLVVSLARPEQRVVVC